ncbi:glycosyl hydrolase [Ruminococcus sp.]|mgnify:CR=1 FL=1|uniref:glycosyl hydrolase n=1 Tax=Ruminococcus sp. TaxID=41978 RepID=UPI002CB16463|nr:glycosyl hydrolase [Ruminococcus sp.]HNZ99662.1 glycosyl hydrolase [Ruminococcus sp.]HOH86021.1 glycosyl hydrolase [Ruminococcus sp.]
MKKLISAIISSALAVSTMAIAPFQSDAAGDQYEFEEGTISSTGENSAEISALSGASGGRAVDLKDGGNSVTVKVNAAGQGMHRITLRYCQPYDEDGKYQKVLINGKDAGEIFCEYTGDDKFSTVSVSAQLNAGSNDITVEASWGWTLFDRLLIEKGDFTAYSGGGKLSNPKASAQTQSLYSFLCDTYGKNVISGQQESTWMGSEGYEFDIIKNASGRYPALRGLDYMGDDFAGCNRRAKKWYEKGGIVTICWHCGSDFSGSHTEAMNTDLNWSTALTEGTAEYNKLIAGMDKGAKALKELKDAGIPVVWRPFHEFDGKWFWWGKGGAENFKKLWRIMYDRYTNYWGLDNLIWSLGYCGDVNAGWYPGDEYVDIIDSDTYVNHTGSLAPMYNKTAQVANKPVCLHENGPIPDPEKMKSEGAKWLWFMTWHTSFIDSNEFNTASYLKQVYNSDYMLTLDELPDIYHYGSPVSYGEDGPTFEIVPSKGIKGDLNGDGQVNVADAVILQKFILGSKDVTAANWVAGDLCEDQVLDVFDMIEMRKLLTAPKVTPPPEQPETPQSTYKFDPAKKYAEYGQNYRSNASKTGTVVKETYNGINGTNSLNVYLPYGYDKNKKYNIYYFMHGMGDSENSLFYNDNGESVRLIDNMIQNGDIEPMIIVTPTFNKVSSDTFYNAENFYKEFRESVVPFVEGKYSTYAASTSMEDIKASRMHRAYGGFSMGSVST